MEQKTISRFFLIVLLGATILLLRLFWTYISAIVLALLIASAFSPIYSRLRRLLRNEAQAASLLMCLIITVVLIIPLGGFVGTLSNEAFDFYKRTRSVVSFSRIEQTDSRGRRLGHAPSTHRRNGRGGTQRRGPSRLDRLGGNDRGPVSLQANPVHCIEPSQLPHPLLSHDPGDLSTSFETGSGSSDTSPTCSPFPFPSRNSS